MWNSSSFLSFFLPVFLLAFFCFLAFLSVFPFLSSLLLFHEKNNIKIFNCKVFLHQSFLFIGWCVLCGTSSRSAADLICFWCIVEGQFKPAHSKSQRFCRWKSYIFKATFNFKVATLHFKVATLNLRKWVSLNKVATLFKVVLGIDGTSFLRLLSHFDGMCDLEHRLLQRTT